VWTRAGSWLFAGLVTLSACAGRGSGSKSADPAAATGPTVKNAPSQVLSPADITAHATPAIVSVRAGDSLGTGFIVRPDGWIATNFHVVRGSTSVTIVLSDHREFPVVEIMNANRQHDLVILRIDAHALPVLTVGDSDAVRPGDSVLAIGHPLGLEDTVSNGLISAIRHIHSGLTVLQVSAPIAPGSSGGPLFNDHGEVIGVATAFMKSGQNLNFGLPSKYVQELVDRPHPISMALFAAAMTAVEHQESAPAIARQIPHHPPAFLHGCSASNQTLILQTLHEAIDVGAPLYNEGKMAACYHVYDGAADDLAHHLPASCDSAKRALSDGQKRAAKLNDPSAQAWAMRDSFDGLLELLEH